MCFGDSCVVAGGAGGTFQVQIPPPASASADVIVRTRVAGVVASELHRTEPVRSVRPNGGSCPPQCKVIEVSL